MEREAVAADRRVGLACAARSHEQRRLKLPPYDTMDDDELDRRHERWRSELTIVEDSDVGKPPKERSGFRGHSLGG